MLREHPLYLVASILIASGFTFVLVRRLRATVQSARTHPPEERSDQ